MKFPGSLRVKKGILLLVFSMLTTQLSACKFEIPSISEAKRVVEAYVHYHQIGEIPEDVNEILENYTNSTDSESDNLAETLRNTPSEILESTLKKITKSDVLSLAEQYYNIAYPNIEADTKSEYERLVSWEPDFSGKKLTSEELELQKHSSINVSLSLSYTNAKNFYLAMAATVFGKNPEDVTAAGNFAGALAAFADDSISEGTPANKLSKYYEHAEKVYHYALLLAGGRDAHYTHEALPSLVSLGNLYLDSNKHEEAYGCFQTALLINKGYSPATEGLYNTYMALKQYKKALELVAETSEYPAFISASKKVSKRLEEDAKKPGLAEGTSDEEKLQLACDSLNTVESVSVGDYLGELDSEAQEKLNKLVLSVQNRMKYKAPDIVLISQYSNLRAISEPMGESALEAFSEGMDQYIQKAEELQEKTINEEISEDTAIKISEYAMQYQKDRKYETLKLFYQTISEICPEFSVFTLNPYEYTNPLDIVVQRQNINLFNRKYLTYSGYLGVANSKVIEKTDEIIKDCNEKVEKLWDEMNKKLENLDDNASASQVHAIHANYYPKINNTEAIAWQQATQITVSAYQKKIKKYAEQMYNDCMKHVILISDDTVGQKLEEKLQGGVMSSLATIYYEIYRSFSFVRYTGDCGCDEKAMKAQQEAEEKERKRLANEQIKKNMEAKKRFETGELDENSEYYKKIIKPYEVKINSPFFEGAVGPYKSGFQVKIELPDAPPVIEFGKMENHIRNTSTYNGGIEFGAGPVKTYLKFSAAKGANGNFSAEDVDVVGGGNVSFSKAFANFEVGMEASAVRGTKTYANFSVSGDDLLNEEFKSYMGNWSPDLSKELWNREYPMK